MNRICIIGCPKPFQGDGEKLQVDAVRSWLLLENADVLLVGSASELETVPEDLAVGTAEISVVEDERRDSRLPYFSQVIEAVPDRDRYDILVYLNADIILPPDFLERLQGDLLLRSFPSGFLVTGRRIELPEGVPYDSEAGFYSFLRENFARSPVGRFDHMDYFAFSRGVFDDLAPLIIGRGAYDNALVAHCLRRRIPVVDASEGIPVIHPFHGHGHQKGGKAEVYDGNDAKLNRERHDIQHSPPTSLDAEWVLGQGGLRRASTRGGFVRRIEVLARYAMGLKKVSYGFRAVSRLLGLEVRAERNEQARITGIYSMQLEERDGH